MPSPGFKYAKVPSDSYYLEDADGHNNRCTTAMGRVTIQALDLNHDHRIRIRRAEQLFGLYPPDHNND